MADRALHVICVGVSHQTATLAAREHLALSGSRGQAVCSELHAARNVAEVVAIATCNRSELYLAAHDPAAAIDAALAAMSRLAGPQITDVATMLVVREGASAIDHLFRVAGGIESVVTGEAQIQGQLRQARDEAIEQRTSGPVLDRLFRRAVEVGKRARSETRIGAGRASIGSVAAELVAGARGGSLDDALVVVVGAGKMGGLAARSLAQRGARRVDVANRSQERAEQVVASCPAEGDALYFTEIDEELVRCDALVSATNAPHLLITPERIEAAMLARGGRELVLVDLAVPRDIDPGCADVAGVHMFDLDDLERVVDQTLHVRHEEIEAVELLAQEAAAEFLVWLRAEAATPHIRAMRARAEAARQAELARLLARLDHLSDEDRIRIDRLTRTIVNRKLHAPTMQLRQAAERVS